MCRVEMALFQAVLHREQLKFSWVPPHLCILQAGGTNLDNTCLALRVLLKEDEAEAIYAGVRHGVE